MQLLTGEYTVIQDNKVLRLWNNEDENLDKVFKATLSAEVHIQHEGWALGAMQGRGRVWVRGFACRAPAEN